MEQARNIDVTKLPTGGPRTPMWRSMLGREVSRHRRFYWFIAYLALVVPSVGLWLTPSVLNTNGLALTVFRVSYAVLWLVLLSIGATVGSREILAGNEEFEWSLPPRPAIRYWIKAAAMALPLVACVIARGVVSVGVSWESIEYYARFPSPWLIITVVLLWPLSATAASFSAASNTSRSVVMTLATVAIGWAVGFFCVQTQTGGGREPNVPTQLLGLLLLILIPSLFVVGGIEYGRREFIGPDSKYLGWVTRGVLTLVGVMLVMLIALLIGLVEPT